MLGATLTELRAEGLLSEPVQGDHIVVVINDIKTVDIHDSTHKSGPLALQYAAGTIKFRNVQLMKL